NRSWLRQRGAGRTPPHRLSSSRTVEGCRRISRARTLIAWPDRHRRHTSSTSASDSGVLFSDNGLVEAITHHIPVHQDIPSVALTH
ncbi:hypothetical protein ACFXO7_21350, partial [Nocardia tengchongensis]|uniref:hypothetical protein n=1 Tax=Nocardia tengchongensis TaxID=2055889 RepID=UPI0036825454